MTRDELKGRAQFTAEQLGLTCRFQDGEKLTVTFGTERYGDSHTVAVVIGDDGQSIVTVANAAWRFARDRYRATYRFDPPQSATPIEPYRSTSQF